MNIVQERLVKSYATLVIAKQIDIEEVPKIRVIGGVEYLIRSKVEIEIANRTIAPPG